MKTKRQWTIAVLVLWLAGSSMVAGATQTFFGEDYNNGLIPTAFTNANAARDAFMSHLTTKGTETFEGFADGATSPVALNFGDAGTGALTGPTQVMIGSLGWGSYAISGSKLWTNADIDNPFTLTLSAPRTALGFYCMDAGDGNGQIKLTLDGMRTIIVPNYVDPAHAVNYESSVLYFGLIEDVPFTTIQFGADFGTRINTGDGAGYDDLTVGVVPEPFTFALLAVGGLAILRRRKS